MSASLRSKRRGCGEAVASIMSPAIVVSTVSLLSSGTPSGFCVTKKSAATIAE